MGSSLVMSPRLLRLVYVCEFLLALFTIFTAWSEIGGQATLDLMFWGWKLGLSVGFAAAFVAWTVALLTEDSVWNLRSARWLSAIIVLLLAMGAVTYFYSLQVDAGDSDESAPSAAHHAASVVFRAS
jgi:glucan phosphoethanolaminetransferase (alkaline phosphatase superfamily)